MSKQRAGDVAERGAHQALGRAMVYRLLSQSLSFPHKETVETLRREDLAQAQQVAAHLPARVAVAVAVFAEAASDIVAEDLLAEHRRVFTHVMSVDCPPNETVYTTNHIFQETRELGDIVGFYRAFGLELAERERADHVSVELEFMHLVTFKEGYARLHHTQGKVRLCRSAQRAFLRDHLGRWTPRFAELLRRKAGGGYYAAVADLTDVFIAAELARLRVRPEAVVAKPDLTLHDGQETDGCPFVEECPLPEMGAGNVRAYSS